MAEIKHQEEPTLSSKRKPDLTCDDNPKKTTKLEAPPDNNIDSSVFKEKNNFLESSEHDSSIAQEKDCKFETDLLAEAEAEAEDEDEDEDEDDYDDEEEDEDEDDEDGEDGNGKAEVDQRGKGILRDDKGKGKLILEDDDEDEDDGSDISNGESDLSDDPLAEVDLDNILPSRTRKRTIQPGVYIASDLGNNDDDSDGSDA
ncbi:nucleoplasmin-like protein ANO39 [Juglans microcarpa x Juglans regia]|uniref:nucleoplasmin-like protein ANO39 n=1 Tax=Juglans microcarpa x Juglans regia TaxID=2249226 RepID=UPI001B7EC826|nr:nucleoplasmin-like protein ANO39 [Juglans microcarpa x Juglans regia]